MATVRKKSRDLMSELRALGTLCHEQGDLTRAEEHFRLALGLYDSSHPNDHIDAALSLFGLVEVLRKRGRGVEAERIERMLEEMNGRRRSD